MKSVLVVAYYFPPSGGPGVQRVLKFVKYMREFGWQPVVLTVESADYPARDESLLKEIPDDVPVYRTKIFEPYDWYRKFTGKKAGTPVDVNTIPSSGARRSMAERLAEFIRATFFIPDARIGWYRHAVKEGLRVIQKHDISALYSSSPPYTSALIARRLKRLTGLPWIAGFRDPWRGFLSTPKRWFIPDLVDRYFERHTYLECDRMEVAWTGIRKDFAAKYPGIPVEKVIHLPNGFDSDDYPDLPPLRNERFTVTYTGSMYGKRNPKAFLEGVRTAIKSGKVSLDDIQLQFVGRFGDEVMQMLRDPVLAPAISILGYLPHSESIQRLLTSDALLMVVDDYPGNEEIVPGKVFEYIGSHKPIIALAPEGAVSGIIRETRSGIVCSSHDHTCIASAFLTLFNRWKRGERLVEPDENAIRQYERREITKRLSTILDEITQNTP